MTQKRQELNIEYINIEDLVPYENNPRFNDEAVEYVANSIREFGFKVPIVIDKNNVIIAGHTRLKASKELGLDKVPCIRANDLNDDQVKAFRLADNKVSELAEWNDELLSLELEDITIDMSQFGIEIDVPEVDVPDLDDDGWYGDERERTNDAYNLSLIDWNNMTDGFWEMPVIQNDGFIPKELIGFNYAKTSQEKNVGIHFYVDDYQFERVWNAPEKYVEILSEYDCILSPDFSLYVDMPTPMKIWNVYRSRQIGAYYQSMGIRVIPTISWAESKSFQYCFEGIPEGSIVSISTVGVKKDASVLSMWSAGMDEMISRINPSAILLYGGMLEYDFADIDVYEYGNKVLENWKGK